MRFLSSFLFCLTSLLVFCVVAPGADDYSTAVARKREQVLHKLGSGPRLGVNLAGVCDWNTELPFVDVFLETRSWISQRAGKSWGEGPVLDLDERGWIRNLEENCWAEVPLCTIEGGNYPSGA